MSFIKLTAVLTHVVAVSGARFVRERVPAPSSPCLDGPELCGEGSEHRSASDLGSDVASLGMSDGLRETLGASRWRLGLKYVDRFLLRNLSTFHAVDEVLDWHEKDAEDVKVFLQGYIQWAGSQNRTLTRYVHLPEDADLVVVGDVHGHFASLRAGVRFFRDRLSLNSNTYVVFLGDLVDRGMRDSESALAVLALEMLMSQRVFVLRGNHEHGRPKSRPPTFSFYASLRATFGADADAIRNLFYEAFRFLPGAVVATVPHLDVKHKYAIVHGGFSPFVLQNWDRFADLPLANLKRNAEILDTDEAETFMRDLVWSQVLYDDVNFTRSSRGSNLFAFGLQAIAVALENLAVDFCITGHRHDNKIIYVPNSSRQRGLAVVLTADRFSRESPQSHVLLIESRRPRLIPLSKPYISEFTHYSQATEGIWLAGPFEAKKRLEAAESAASGKTGSELRQPHPQRPVTAATEATLILDDVDIKRGIAVRDENESKDAGVGNAGVGELLRPKPRRPLAVTVAADLAVGDVAADAVAVGDSAAWAGSGAASAGVDFGDVITDQPRRPQAVRPQARFSGVLGDAAEDDAVVANHGSTAFAHADGASVDDLKTDEASAETSAASVAAVAAAGGTVAADGNAATIHGSATSVGDSVSGDAAASTSVVGDSSAATSSAASAGAMSAGADGGDAAAGTVLGTLTMAAPR